VLVYDYESQGTYKRQDRQSFPKIIMLVYDYEADNINANINKFSDNCYLSIRSQGTILNARNVKVPRHLSRCPGIKVLHQKEQYF
jgi:hypothetical protein